MGDETEPWTPLKRERAILRLGKGLVEDPDHLDELAEDPLSFVVFLQTEREFPSWVTPDDVPAILKARRDHVESIQKIRDFLHSLND